MEGIPDEIDSKFRFVLLAAHRAEQMMRGARPKVEVEDDRKLSLVAIQEVMEDRVDWGYGPAEEEVAEEGAEESGETESEEE